MAKLRGGLNILFYTPVLVFFLFHKAGRQLKLRVIPCQLEDFKGHPDDQDIDRKDADDPGDGNQNAELCELFRKGLSLENLHGCDEVESKGNAPEIVPEYSGHTGGGLNEPLDKPLYKKKHERQGHCQHKRVA
ncbi:hypothetical protein SDC9_211821 [bioreactor metagenome]|uniref:Uncharacterized protein n=1 Tax=bioreactor metagenome TaxID=1076179 RepID=A0A645JLS5_9ZZZZ